VIGLVPLDVKVTAQAVKRARDAGQRADQDDVVALLAHLAGERLHLHLAVVLGADQLSPTASPAPT
jgi:hypothetical protein